MHDDGEESKNTKANTIKEAMVLYCYREFSCAHNFILSKSLKSIMTRNQTVLEEMGSYKRILINKNSTDCVLKTNSQGYILNNSKECSGANSQKGDTFQTKNVYKHIHKYLTS